MPAGVTTHTHTQPTARPGQLGWGVNPQRRAHLTGNISEKKNGMLIKMQGNTTYYVPTPKKR